jgi:GxxExxY protein
LRVHRAEYARGWIPEKSPRERPAQELRDAGLAVDQQHRVKVHYHGVVAGGCSTGLLAADMLLVELKTVRALDDVHRTQCTNYLQATALLTCKRPACRSACCSISASHARKSNAWSRAYKIARNHLHVPRASSVICVSILSRPVAPHHWQARPVP